MVRILVIEDDDIFREVLEEALKRNGYEVTTAPDGEEGMKLFYDAPFPLVITDIVMPKKEGIETTLELHTHFPETKVIAISGGGMADPKSYLSAVQSLPNVQYALRKPFAMDVLLRAVKAILDEGGK